MKAPEDIKKGLECRKRGFSETCDRLCSKCMFYVPNLSIAELYADALDYIRQLESREWELFDLLSSAWYGKQCYSRQEDGTVYSRQSCEYLTFDQAIDEFANELTVEREDGGCT